LGVPPASSLQSSSSQSEISNPQSQIPNADLFGQPVPASKPTAKPKSSSSSSFVIRHSAFGITTGTLRDFVQGKPLPENLESEVNQLAEQYRFFHWHIAFPQVFEQGGFDCILGNPPWERIQVEALQFFASRRPELTNMNRSQRETAIEFLRSSDPSLFSEWIETRRSELGSTGFLKASHRFPLSTEKNINSYAVFTELALGLVTPTGRCGLITQSGIATDDIMKSLFRHLVSTKRLVSIFDFENREKIFASVHPQLKFCLITISGSDFLTPTAEFIFYATKVSDLGDHWRRFSLSNEEVQLLNPNTQTCPIFRSGEAAALCLFLYRKVPVIITEEGRKQNMWQVAIRRMFDMAYDSHLFHTRIQQSPTGVNSLLDVGNSSLLRLYEAKFIHQFDHRFASFGHSSNNDNECIDFSDFKKKDPTSGVIPRYWVSSDSHRQKMDSTGWDKSWIVAFREITNTTNERTSICAIVPEAGVGHTCYTLTFDESSPQNLSAFLANSNSFIFDWITRQKVAGTHLSVFILKQLPALPPDTYDQPCPWAAHPQSTIHDPPSLRDWLLPRVLELTYTAWDLEAFAADCGWPGPPFRWDEDRRFLLRCELDAAFFHLYLGSEDEWGKESGGEDGTTSSIQHSKSNIQNSSALTRAFPTPRHAVSYIMDTFPIVKRKDEAKHGSYRTKDTILQIYDALAESIATSTPYQTLLDPPPADTACCHPHKNEQEITQS
jgi:hypothetical protein